METLREKFREFSVVDAFWDARRFIARMLTHRRAAWVLILLLAPLLAVSATPLFVGKAGAMTTGAAFGKLGILGGAIGQAQQQKVQKLPFRFGTARRRQPIGTFTLTPGGQIPSTQIPQVGMLARVFVTLKGTYDYGVGGTSNLFDGYDAIVNRAKINVNNGAATIVDLSGVGIRAINKQLRPALPIKRGLLFTNAAQTFAYKFILPVNANQRRQFDMGLINLQAPELRCTVDMSFGTLAQIFSTPGVVTNFTATCSLSYEYYEIPDPTRFDLPALTIVRSLEDAPVAVAATGDQVYQIPRMGTLLNYSVVAVFNNVYGNVTTAFTRWRWIYNYTDTQYDVSMDDQETSETELWQGSASGALTFLDTAAFSFNFWAAQDREYNGGDFRDAIDTEENTTTQSITTVSSGQALNAGKDSLFHVRRIVQRIVATSGPIVRNAVPVA